MTNYEKLKSLCEADDKDGVVNYMLDHIIHYQYMHGNYNESDYIDEEYDEDQRKKEFFCNLFNLEIQGKDESL